MVCTAWKSRTTSARNMQAGRRTVSDWRKKKLSLTTFGLVWKKASTDFACMYTSQSRAGRNLNSMSIFSDYGASPHPATPARQLYWLGHFGGRQWLRRWNSGASEQDF